VIRREKNEPVAWDWRWWGVITAFTIAMALVEAVVVVYLRALLGIPAGPIELNRAVTDTLARHSAWLVPTEQCREAATMVMLATIAALAGGSRTQKIGVWLYAFGLWDIFYYIWLYVFIRWPASLLTSDILFLIPVPWIAPVLLPVSAATGMVVVGLRLMAAGRPVRLPVPSLSRR
jgi:hypothetical protein